MTSTQRFWKQKFSSLKNISTHNKGTILHIKLKEQIMMPKLQISCKLLIRMVYRSTSTYLGLRFRLGSLTHTAGYAAFTFTQAIMKDNTGGYLKMYWIPHLLKGTPKEKASNQLWIFPCKTAPSKFEFINIFSQRNYNSFQLNSMGKSRNVRGNATARIAFKLYPDTIFIVWLLERGTHELGAPFDSEEISFTREFGTISMGKGLITVRYQYKYHMSSLRLNYLYHCLKIKKLAFLC